MSDPFSTATIVFALHYIGAGMAFVTIMKSPRKQVFLYRGMTVLNGAQLVSSSCMVIVHTVGQNLVAAIVSGVMLCIAIHFKKQLREKRFLYQDYIETNSKILEMKDKMNRLLGELERQYSGKNNR